MLGLGCFHCPKYHILFSRINRLISWVLKQMVILVVDCIMLKQSFAFLPLLYWGIKVCGKINVDELRSQISVCRRYWAVLPILSCVFMSLSYLCSSYLTFLSLRPLSWKVTMARITAKVTPKMWSVMKYVSGLSIIWTL